jgi:hypothetical protein
MNVIFVEVKIVGDWRLKGRLRRRLRRRLKGRFNEEFEKREAEVSVRLVNERQWEIFLKGNCFCCFFWLIVFVFISRLADFLILKKTQIMC